MTLRLHRSLMGSGYWQVLGTPFAVAMSVDRRWGLTISCPDSRNRIIGLAFEWLTTHGLHGDTGSVRLFASRREAMQALAATLAVDPLPSELTMHYESLTRCGDGWMSRDYRFVVRRGDGGWYLHDRHEHGPAWLPSLHDVRFQIRYIRSHGPPVTARLA